MTPDIPDTNAPDITVGAAIRADLNRLRASIRRLPPGRGLSIAITDFETFELRLRDYMAQPENTQ